MFLVADYQRLRLFEGIFSEYAAHVEPVCMYTCLYTCSDDLFFNNLTTIDLNQCCFLLK